MSVTLLLADPQDPSRSARAVSLHTQLLQTSPGGEDVTVSFRPNRSDDLYASAKFAARLAYRILFREGILRSQVVVRLELGEAPHNVVGRSADLPFALSMLSRGYEQNGHGGTNSFPEVAATGVLEADGTVRAVDHVASKLEAAACNGLGPTIFFPAENRAEVDLEAFARRHPDLKLRAVAHLDEALEHLGILLERVYLRNPFRGLEYFDYEHHAIFFGRDREIREVIEQLLRREGNGRPGVLVEGASGSGKSSFVRAGLLPALVNPSSLAPQVAEALRQRPLPDSVRKAIWRPGYLGAAAGEEQVAQSILECWRAIPEFAGTLPPACASLAALAEEHQRHWPGTQRFVWLIDQFEELFILGLPEQTIDAFGTFLLQLQSRDVWTLICIRSDAVCQLKQYSRLREVFGANEGQYYLETMSGTALDDVIERPAEVAGLSFGVGPSGRRLDQVLREQLYAMRENTLPLLQFTLQELYQRRLGSLLQFETFAQLGGLSGSIATAAEAAVRTDTGYEPILPRIFRSLVSVDDEGRASKRYAPVEEIASGPAEQRLLGRLVGARLCVTDQHDGSAVVAFAHEALLRTWPRLRDWLTREGALLQARDLLIAEARRWEQHGKRRDWLLTAPDRLASIRRVIEANIPVPELARQFARESAMRSLRATRVRQLAVLSITALGVMAIVFGLYAQHAGNIASGQRDAAFEAQRRSLTQAAAARLSTGDVAGASGMILEVLANRAGPRRYTADAANVFQEARVADVQVFAITGHTGILRSAAFSPDGRQIVTASDDKTARVWDARTGRQVLLLSGHTDRVASAAFSPDGRQIVTASEDKTARVWDARTGRQVLLLSGHTDPVLSAAFSPDGRQIVTASEDKTARVWDARSGRPALLLRGHTGPVYTAAFSPDGRQIVTASVDKTARVWDARSGRQVLLLSGHTDWVDFAAFSPDGTQIVTASLDKTARVWDARSGRQVLLLSGHTDRVASAAFSPDGRQIVTASLDRTARVWDARSVRQVVLLSGHTGLLYMAAFSPDGRQIVTASFDKTARVWDARSGRPVLLLSGHTDRVAFAAFSPDERQIVTASDDKTARVWDARSGRQVLLLRGHTDSVESVVFSPDGRQIVTASDDRTARVWDARTGRQVLLLRHTDRVASAAFSPDGRQIVTASTDKTARVWDARTGRQVLLLSGHTDRVYTAAFSPDGRQIVTASFDRTARVWDARSGRQVLLLSGHTGPVYTAAFSPDGGQIVTASWDRIPRVWDARSGQPVLLLRGHTDSVWSAAFSPDGRQIVTASDDKTARVWDARALPLETQIEWAEAAQFDPLPASERFQLGLPLATDVRRWSAEESTCDQSAAAPYDPARRAPGVTLEEIVADVAARACTEHDGDSGSPVRSIYQHGRALMAKADFSGAKRDFDLALAGGYRAAAVDLGMLLTRPSAAMLDVPKAISLYEQAWKSGVTIASFELGNLYEHGVRRGGNDSGYLLAPDEATAWTWYQKGADAGEPTALARFGAEEDRAALTPKNPAGRTAHLLSAFNYYASAAERARLEDWPDSAWRDWRYRRASIARVLAREGSMEDVAGEYGDVRERYAPHPTVWQRVASSMGLE